MHNLDIVLRTAIPVVVGIAGLVLLTYNLALVRDAFRNLIRFVESCLYDLAGVFERSAGTVRHVLLSSTRLLTHNGQFPLPLLIVAVAVLTPVLVLIVVVEVRLWAGYFESLFPEDIELPILGAVSAGVLTAAMPVAAGFLLGWLLEAMLGAFPLPILGASIGSIAGHSRLRGVLACVLIALWVLLAVTVVDAANEVYDGLGESTCALRAAGDSGVAVSAFDLSSPLSPAAPSTPPGSTAAQATCLADWKADDQARSIRIVLGELALHLSALFAWSVLAGAGLLMLVALCVPIIGMVLAAGVTRLCARVTVGVGVVVEMLLGLLHAVGVLVVRLLRWAGLPLPVPESGLASAATVSAPMSNALAGTDGRDRVDGSPMLVSVNGSNHLPPR